MQRRSLLTLTSTALAAVTIRAASDAAAQAPPASGRSVRPTIVLIHGAWHGAWCWSAVTQRLATSGFNAVAIDLPGHGIDARFPEDYFAMPQDLRRLTTAPSPLASLNLEAYRRHVTTNVEGLVANGSGPVVLVAHSLGGVTLNAIGEASPQLVRRLVYLTALAPVAKPAAGAYFSDPAMATSKALPLFIGDPAMTGAVRFNHRSTDPAFAAAVKAAFFGDVSDHQFAAVSTMLTPDEPAAVFGDAATVTAARWGRVPRTYIRCTEDQALPIAAQDQFIAEGNALTQGVGYVVRTLRSSHSPFLSMPAELARLIEEAAA